MGTGFSSTGDRDTRVNKYNFPAYKEWEIFAIRSAIAMSSDLNEADQYVDEFSKVNEAIDLSDSERFAIKLRFLKEKLFGFPMIAAFCGTIKERTLKEKDDYYAYLSVVLDLKWS